MSRQSEVVRGEVSWPAGPRQCVASSSAKVIPHLEGVRNTCVFAFQRAFLNPPAGANGSCAAGPLGTARQLRMAFDPSSTIIPGNRRPSDKVRIIPVPSFRLAPFGFPPSPSAQTLAIPSFAASFNAELLST